MRCDVVAVGTELLLGQIIDTNSAWLGEQLAAGGIDSLLQVKVGDNLGRVVDALRRAVGQADAVIVCGGLGPTHDDLTREAIAELMGVTLIRDEALVEVIAEMFATRGRYMPENNLRQAMVPEGASIIAQPRGLPPWRSPKRSTASGSPWPVPGSATRCATTCRRSRSPMRADASWTE